MLIISATLINWDHRCRSRFSLFIDPIVVSNDNLVCAYVCVLERNAVMSLTTPSKELPDSKEKKIWLNCYHSLSYTLNSLTSLLLVYPEPLAMDVLGVNPTPRCHVLPPIYITRSDIKPKGTKDFAHITSFIGVELPIHTSDPRWWFCKA